MLPCRLLSQKEERGINYGPFTAEPINRQVKRIARRAGLPPFTRICRATPAASPNCRPPCAAHSGLARLPIDPAHDALHAIERGAVQGLLEVGGASRRRRGSDLKVRRLPLPHSIGQFFEALIWSQERTTQKLLRHASQQAHLYPKIYIKLILAPLRRDQRPIDFSYLPLSRLGRSPGRHGVTGSEKCHRRALQFSDPLFGPS
jgi:hypothetical protein